MLLITKDRFCEPTMFMKTKQISGLTHDLYDSKGNGSGLTTALHLTALAACRSKRGMLLLSVHSPRAAHNLQQLDGRTLLRNPKDLRVELLQSSP
jgi:hypothetical protein